MACWAHARREFFDEHARTKSALALQALEKIGALFAIERRGINGRSAEDRRAVRQAQSVPLLAGLKAFLETSLNRISGRERSRQGHPLQSQSLGGALPLHRGRAP